MRRINKFEWKMKEMKDLDEGNAFTGFLLSLFLRQFDYFQHQKQDSYWNSLDAIKGLAKYFKTSCYQKQQRLQEAQVIFRHFIEVIRHHKEFVYGEEHSN